MENELTETLRRQIQERVERRNQEMQKHLGKIIADYAGPHESDNFSPEGYAEFSRRRTEEEIARTLFFALEIAQRDGVTGELNEDQFTEATWRATQQHSRQMLSQFAERTQKSTTLPSARRRLAEDLLGMAGRHLDLMDRRLADPKSVTESALGEVAEEIAGDMRDLTRKHFPNADIPKQ